MNLPIQKIKKLKFAGGQTNQTPFVQVYGRRYDRIQEAKFGRIGPDHRRVQEGHEGLREEAAYDY